MKHTSFSQMNCSVAQTLSVVGERWTLLILHQCFVGASRFSEFLDGLTIARNVLSQRLNSLVENEILERRPSGTSGRPEYVLTPKGLELQVVVMALMQWGDKHMSRPDGSRLTVSEAATGLPIQSICVRSTDGRPLSASELSIRQEPESKDLRTV